MKTVLHDDQRTTQPQNSVVPPTDRSQSRHVGVGVSFIMKLSGNARVQFEPVTGGPGVYVDRVRERPGAGRLYNLKRLNP